MRRALGLVLALLLSTPACAERVTFPAPDGAVLSADLVRPDAPARAPAIVALHGCGGPFRARDAQWADVLSKTGHIVLFPDSFGSRGLGSQCGVRSRAVTASGLRRADALASATWLAGQPGTPSGGVVILGWSDGGSTTLATGRQADDLPPGLIRGLVAFYPGCRGFSVSATWRPAASLLILMGESDDWTPAAPCHALADRFNERITLVTYPGAYHDFDAPAMPVRLRSGVAFSADGAGTVHAGTDAAGRDDALVRVPAFLDRLVAGP